MLGSDRTRCKIWTHANINQSNIPFNTVIVMILSRYRYLPVNVPLQFWALRYRSLPFSGQRYSKLRNVTYRVTSVTDRYMGFSEYIFKVL